MTAKKKATTKRAAAPAAPRRFRVLKSFGFEGVLYARHNEAKIAELPDFEIEDRLERKFIVEQRQRAPATTDTQE